MKRGILRCTAVLVMAAMALMLATCVSAEERDMAKYDAASDQFHMLMVLTDIRAKEPDDLEYLEALYKNRDHLIAPIIPGGAAIFPMLAINLIRVSDTQVASVNFFGSRPTSFDVGETAADMKDIKITPGTFFLENKKLGFYQAVTIPGKTIDGWLDELSKKAPDDAIKGIDAEIARRAGGGKTSAWAELKDNVMKKMAITAKPAAGEAPPAEEPAIDPVTVLDIESLKKIKQALTDKTLKLTRQKQVILLALPLVAADATQAADLITALVKRVDEVIKEAKETPDTAGQIKMAKSLQAALKAVSATADAKGLVVSLDILKLADAAAALPLQRVDLNSTMQAGGAENPPAEGPGPDAVAYMRDHKIPLDENLTADQIIKDFNAGTLKGHPSETPVKPGEGIVKPSAPKEPANGMP